MAIEKSEVYGMWRNNKGKRLTMCEQKESEE